MNILVHTGPEVIKVQHQVYEVTAKILIKLYRLLSMQTEQEQQTADFRELCDFSLFGKAKCQEQESREQQIYSLQTFHCPIQPQ